MNEWQYECGGGDGGVVGMHRAVLILIYRFLSSAFRMHFSIDMQPVHYHFVAGNGFAYRLHTDGDDGEATAVIATLSQCAGPKLHIVRYILICESELVCCLGVVFPFSLTICNTRRDKSCVASFTANKKRNKNTNIFNDVDSEMIFRKPFLRSFSVFFLAINFCREFQFRSAHQSLHAIQCAQHYFRCYSNFDLSEAEKDKQNVLTEFSFVI